MKKQDLILFLLIVIFLLPRKQMVLGYLNKIALQNPVDNSAISLVDEFGIGTFNSFTIGFWLHYSPPTPITNE